MRSFYSCKYFPKSIYLLVISKQSSILPQRNVVLNSHTKIFITEEEYYRNSEKCRECMTMGYTDAINVSIT